MIVFKYFLKKMDEFGPLMDEREQKEQQEHKEQQEAAEQEAAEQGPYDFMEEEEEETAYFLEEEEGETVEEVSTFTLSWLNMHIHVPHMLSKCL